MLVDSGVVERTQLFYDWELRGRGWQLHPVPVALEPPFVPFRWQRPAGSRQLDDTRRPTFFSSLVEGFRKQPALLEEPEDEEIQELVRQPSVGVFDELTISLPEEDEIWRSEVVRWLTALSPAAGAVGFELVAVDGRTEVRLAVEEQQVEHVVGQLQGVIPGAVIARAEKPVAEYSVATEGQFAAVEFGLGSEFMVPLAVPHAKEEPLLPFISALSGVRKGEFGLVQVMFEEVHHRWADNIMRSVSTPSGQPFFADAPEISELASEKCSSRLFAVVVRLAAIASETRSRKIIRRLAGGLSQFGTPQTNEFIPLPTDEAAQLGMDVMRRTTHRSGMLLNVEELASLVKFPGAGVAVPSLVRAIPGKEAPVSVRGEGGFLGENSVAGETVDVRLAERDRLRHTHVIGASGTGKSTLLVNAILQDIEAGTGVAVLDPHGDLIDDILGRMPETRAEDVILFDPSDPDYVVGWNILEARSEPERQMLASDLVGVFRRMSTSWGDQMTSVLANAILAFLDSTRGGSLLDLRRFLVDKAYRDDFLPTLRDEHLASYWTTEFPLLVGKRPQGPILTRLDTLLRSRLVRDVVTTNKKHIDFREVVDRRRIFLGRLSQGAIGEENAALLGSLLVSKLHQVILSRQDVASGARSPFFLYLDEFHELATPSMATMFSGVRKYGLGLVVAHQDLYQLHGKLPEVERAVLANAHVRICFRVGDDDAKKLGPGFSAFDAKDLTGLGLGEAICRVGSSNDDFNLRTFPLDEIDAKEARERRERISKQSFERWGVRRGGGEEEQVEPKTTDPEPPPAEPQPQTQTARDAEPAQEVKIETPPSRPELDKELLDYLELVASEPFLTVRERNDELGLSAWKGQQLKSKLVDLDLLREVAINPGGRGRRFQLLEFTTAGREALASFGINAPLGHGRGGIVHQWWTRAIADWLEEHGHEVSIEDSSHGARVDLVFPTKKGDVAVEIEMSDGNALSNIKKDLEAGFSTIVSLVNGTSTLDKAVQRLRSDLGEPPAQLVLAELRDYQEALAPLARSSRLRRPNQNQEPSRRRRRRKPVAAVQQSPVAITLEDGSLSTPVAASYLGLSPATLETYRTRGGGPPFSKLGRRVVYRKEDLDTWLSERKKDSTSQY